MKDFNGRVVVLTGAATGIGLAFARQFAQRGANLVIAARRRSRLDEAAAELARYGTRVETFVCDVTDRQQVEALADFSWKTFGRVDAIVNNAGVGGVSASVIDARMDDVRATLDVNLFGVWNGVAVFGRRFIAQGTPAAIYNVGSENCFFNALPNAAGYVASKHALLAMSYALREEVPDFITVSLVCPGLVKSELVDVTEFGMDTDRFVAMAMEQMLAGEFLVVSHAYNIERIRPRHREVEAAFAKYAPRYPGDVEFDVRTLGAKHHWF